LNDLVTQGKLNEQQQRNDTDRRRAEKIREENDRTAHRARVLNGLNDVGQRVDAAAAATAAAIRAASENSTANHRGTHTRLDGLSETASAIHAETTGIRTDMNAGFTAANNRIDQLGAKVDGLGTKMDTGFNSVNETQVKQNKRNRIWIGVLALLAFIAWLLTQVYGSNFLFPRGAGAPQYVPVGVPVVTPKPIADPALEKADDHRAFYAPMPVEQQSYAAPAPIVQREVVYVQPAPTPEPQREVWMTSCQQIPMDNPVYYNNYSSPGYCDYGQPIFGLSLRLGDSHRGGGNFGHGGGARFCPPPVHYCPPPPPRCGPPHHR